MVNCDNNYMLNNVCMIEFTEFHKLYIIFSQSSKLTRQVREQGLKAVDALPIPHGRAGTLSLNLGLLTLPVQRSLHPSCLLATPSSESCAD